MTTSEEIRALRRRVSELEARLGAARPPTLPPDLARQVIDASPNPIYVQDEAGRFLLVNEAYARLRQARPAELLSQAPPAREEADAQTWERLAGGATLSREDCHAAPAGPPTWYHTIQKALVQADGRPYLLSISADVTDLKRAREAAEESTRAKEVFLANMSHEIRTPMNGIVGLARLLKKTAVTAEQADYLDLILANADNLLVVINDILDFAKIEAGRLDLETIPFDVAATVRGVTRSLALVAEAKGLELRSTLPAAPLPVVAGDPVRLSQILVNLINNAIKFTHAGHVAVAVDWAAPPAAGSPVALRFSVTDTGIGIAPDQLEQVFQSFTQASSTTTRLYGGTGLGLTISKHLVELQGGQIGVDSAPGQGSCFHFTLPYAPSSQAPALAADAPGHLPPGLLRGLRVLLVEDNDVNLLLACSLLQEWQVELAVATDGEQALRLARAAPYDLILMDIQMPHLNGLEATAALRRAPGPNQHTPIVALTANALKTDVDSYPHAGFTDWLVKPYHENNLYLVLVRNAGRGFPAGASAAAEQPAYNFQGLGKLANDPAFIRKMQQLFIDTVPSQLAELGAALTQPDWAAATRLTHNLKSSFGNLQVEEGLRRLKLMEENLRQGPEPGLLRQHHRAVQQIARDLVAAFVAQLQ
ncbi:ATP-binding protein [Hymenobacter sp. HD11105]